MKIRQIFIPLNTLTRIQNLGFRLFKIDLKHFLNIAALYCILLSCLFLYVNALSSPTSMIVVGIFGSSLLYEHNNQPSAPKSFRTMFLDKNLNNKNVLLLGFVWKVRSIFL